MKLRWFEIFGWLTLGWLVGACFACSALTPMINETPVEEVATEESAVEEPEAQRELTLEERMFNMEALRKQTEEAFAEQPYPKLMFLENEYGDIEIATNLTQIDYELKKLNQKERMKLAREVYDLIMPIAHLLSIEDVANILYRKALAMVEEKEKSYADATEDHYYDAEGEDF